MANSTQENTCTTENVLVIVLSVALVTVLVVAAGVVVCTRCQNKTRERYVVGYQLKKTA